MFGKDVGTQSDLSRRVRSNFGGVIAAIALQAGAPSFAHAEQAPNPPYFSWAGLYFGASMGGALPLHRGETLQAASGLIGLNYDLHPPGRERPGVTFGAQLGYNWQRGPWVYGVETELNFLDGRRAPSGMFPAPPAYAAMGVASYTLTPDDGGNYFASLRGRFGFAFDHALIYATAGVATGGWRGASNLTLNGGGPGNPFTSGHTASSRTKYVLGAGVEYAFADRWSARAEYLYLNQSFGTQVFDDGNNFDFLSKARPESHILRLGLIYNLGDAIIPGVSEGKKKKSGVASLAASARAGTPAVVGTAVNKASTASQSEKIHPTGPTDSGEVERYSFHGQTTVVAQGYPKFPALYSGTNSLLPNGQARATVSTTGFFGLRLWEGGEAYVNPEIDEGYGLAGTLGVAGFPSAEAYKVGHARPYLRFHRYFIRQTIGLGGESETVDPGQNLLGGPVDGNRLVFTVGKYAVPDIFDDNRFAHDGRSGFMNWSVIDMGAFDYAADAWGYTDGAAAEWKHDWWTARVGVFQLSRLPNNEYIEPVLFRQWSPIGEFEVRYKLFGQPGEVKFLGYADIAYMGKYDTVVNAAIATGSTPETANDRLKRTKAGGGVNVEQSITNDLGCFLRASMLNGRYETFDFADIQRSLSGGFVLTGAKWDRPKDAIGIAGVLNGLSGSQVRYFAAGGLGVQIGDGRLSYNGEHILEAYYKYNLADGVDITADYQYINKPAYNKDRGPVNIFAVRLHGEF